MHSLKPLLPLLIILYTAVASAQPKKLRILLIGNSFSQNATEYLDEIAATNGHTIEFGHAERGGCSLQRHWDSVAVSLSDTTRGKLYDKNRSLFNYLQKGKWDVITMQQVSMSSSDSTTYQPYATKLYRYIRKYQPDAKIVVHQTWPYRADAEKFGKIKGEQHSASQKEMWEKSRMAYHKMAKDLGLTILPVGDAFYTVASNPKWAYVKDPAFNYRDIKTDALPVQKNSLNKGYIIGPEGEVKFDPNHANDAGCYLAGLVWYAALFKEDPTKVKFKPASVPEEFAAFLKTTARSAVR